MTARSQTNPRLRGQEYTPSILQFRRFNHLAPNCLIMTTGNRLFTFQIDSLESDRVRPHKPVECIKINYLPSILAQEGLDRNGVKRYEEITS